MSADRRILGGLGWSRQSVTRQGLPVFICDLLQPWAGAEAGFPGAVDAPTPALESKTSRPRLRGPARNQILGEPRLMCAGLWPPPTSQQLLVPLCPPLIHP